MSEHLKRFKVICNCGREGLASSKDGVVTLNCAACSKSKSFIIGPSNEEVLAVMLVSESPVKESYLEDFVLDK